MFKELEKKVLKKGKNEFVTYWENGVMVARRCTKCGIDKEIEEFSFENKNKGTRHSECKECNRKYKKKYNSTNQEHRKQYYLENREHYREYSRKNREHLRELQEQWRANNRERYAEQYKRHNKKQKGQKELKKKNNIIELTNMLHQLNPLLRKLNIKAYGIIYKITNIKTGKCYIGQTIHSSLKERYKGGVVKGWINERKCYENQKFKDELIEKDFKVEVINYGICRYHLDKLEAYYIDKYNSCENGYNNQPGNHNTNDGIEEFSRILNENNLEFINGNLVVKEVS